MNTVSNVYMVGALVRLSHSKKWQGTTEELLNVLSTEAPNSLKESKCWPKSAAEMQSELEKLNLFLSKTNMLSITRKKRTQKHLITIKCHSQTSMADTIFGILLDAPCLDVPADKEMGLNIPNKALDFFRMAIGTYQASLISIGFRGQGIEWSAALVASIGKAMINMKQSSDLPAHYMDLSEVMILMDMWEKEHLSKFSFSSPFKAGAGQ